MLTCKLLILLLSWSCMYFLNCAANKGIFKLNLKYPELDCNLIDLFITVHKIWIELNWNWKKMNWIGIELKDSESDLNLNWIELNNPESNLKWNWIELKEMNWSEPWNLHIPESMMTSSNGNIFRVTGHLCGHKGHWRRALMLPLICTWIYGCTNNREAGDMRRHRAHYDVTVMSLICCMVMIHQNIKNWCNNGWRVKTTVFIG